MPAASPGSAKSPQLKNKATSLFDRRRRNSPRGQATFPVTVMTLAEHGYQHFQGQCQDLSEAGIGVLVAAELDPSEVVTLSFTLSSLLFEARAVVRHRRTCRYGLEFLGLSPEQKALLGDYVSSLAAAD